VLVMVVEAICHLIYPIKWQVSEWWRDRQVKLLQSLLRMNTTFKVFFLQSHRDVV
jgi:hypothetical protein